MTASGLDPHGELQRGTSRGFELDEQAAGRTEQLGGPGQQSGR
jgi:hypothetical protein